MLLESESSVVPGTSGPAWPESPGFGFLEPQAKPKPPNTAWLRLGLAQAAALYSMYVIYILLVYISTIYNVLYSDKKDARVTHNTVSNFIYVEPSKCC